MSEHDQGQHTEHDQHGRSAQDHEQHKKHERKMYLIFAGMITTRPITPSTRPR